MTIISRLALIAAVAAVGTASPAFAEFFNPQEGTGNEVPFSYQSTAPHNDKMAVRHNSHGNSAIRRSGMDAFGMVSGPQTGSDPNDPALTGGGSLGYNRMILQY
jgi:hypothetical protein